MTEQVAVTLYGTLANLAGVTSVALEAATIRDVLRGLETAHPELADHLEAGVSVSIDGRIYTESLFQPVTPENEILILPRIAGG